MGAPAFVFNLKITTTMKRFFFGLWKFGLGGGADVLADGLVGFKICVGCKVFQDE